MCDENWGSLLDLVHGRFEWLHRNIVECELAADSPGVDGGMTGDGWTDLVPGLLLRSALSHIISLCLPSLCITRLSCFGLRSVFTWWLWVFLARPCTRYGGKMTVTDELVTRKADGTQRFILNRVENKIIIIKSLRTTLVWLIKVSVRASSKGREQDGFSAVGSLATPLPGPPPPPLPVWRVLLWVKMFNWLYLFRQISFFFFLTDCFLEFKSAEPAPRCFILRAVKTLFLVENKKHKYCSPEK